MGFLLKESLNPSGTASMAHDVKGMAQSNKCMAHRAWRIAQSVSKLKAKGARQRAWSNKLIANKA